MALLTHWEGEPLGIWRSLWDLSHLEAHDGLDSTNDRARELAREGKGGWSVILAEAQARGRGRGNRTWVSPAGKGLLFSLILPSGDAGWNSLLPIRMGLAVARALENLRREGGAAHGLPVELKWPNDLILGGRKVGGILCEGGGEETLVAGLGINIRHTRGDFPEALRGTAGSLEMILNERVSRSRLLGEILMETRERLKRTGSLLAPQELEEYGRRDHLLGAEIISELEGPGVGSGLTPEGHPLLRRQDGELCRVRAGSVTRIPV